VGTLKGVGRLYLQAVVDTYSSFAFAKLYNAKLAITAADLVYDRVWGYDFGGESNIIEVYVRYLRQKTEEAGEPRLIHTVRGVGYVLREPA
jgi:DNA-binding response OmpR family regulator